MSVDTWQNIILIALAVMVGILAREFRLHFRNHR